MQVNGTTSWAASAPLVAGSANELAARAALVLQDRRDAADQAARASRVLAETRREAQFDRTEEAIRKERAAGLVRAVGQAGAAAASLAGSAVAGAEVAGADDASTATSSRTAADWDRVGQAGAAATSAAGVGLDAGAGRARADAARLEAMAATAEELADAHQAEVAAADARIGRLFEQAARIEDARFQARLELARAG